MPEYKKKIKSKALQLTVLSSELMATDTAHCDGAIGLLFATRPAVLARVRLTGFGSFAAPQASVALHTSAGVRAIVHIHTSCSIKTRGLSTVVIVLAALSKVFVVAVAEWLCAVE